MAALGAKARASIAAAGGDQALALVVGPESVRLLRARRLRGALEPSGDRLQLALEELAVGLVHGFLELVPLIEEEEEDQAVRQLERELRAAAERGGGGGESDGAVLTKARRDHIRVFVDLWERGYVVTFGSKFGADFLIYSDDPEKSHALALIIVKGFEEPFSRVDIVSHGRVAKMVKKQLYYVSVKPQTPSTADPRSQVVFVSLTHALLASRQDVESEQNDM